MKRTQKTKTELREEIKRLRREISALKKKEKKRVRREPRAALEEARKINQLKSDFLSSVSHELRIPLTSIRAFSQILISYEESDEDTRREFLTIINQESERLTRLINDLLDLAKIESGNKEWPTELLNLTEVAANSVAVMEAIAREKSVRLVMDESTLEARVIANRDRMQQVITNILSNAIKFSPAGEKVEIRLGIEKTGKKKSVKLSVSDRGPGIPPADRKIIFEKFKQLGNILTDKPQGTGLGLPISREIILKYGGEIRVESETGKGSTFSFTLPLA